MDELTYESALGELQAIVNQVQSEQIGIDELSAKLERAAGLIAYCKRKLRAADQDLQQLFADQEPG